jgi:hypothetical protein
MAAGRPDPGGSAVSARLEHLRRAVRAVPDHPIARWFAKSSKSRQELHMSKSLVSQTAGTALLALIPFAALPANAPLKPYVVLDKSLSQLRADFNANVGKVRMLYIVGPTCGICLRGMSDLQETVYSKRGDDPRMVTFVIHVPTLGAREANVAPASRLITNRYTTHYWEETGITGKLMQQVIGDDKYVWDFWTIYGPNVIWSDEHLMPAPSFWQHQLDGLPPEKKLEPNVFAAKVNEFLAQVSAASATSTVATGGAKSE